MSPFDEVVEKFLAWKSHNQGRSGRTLAIYRLSLSRLQVFLGPDRDPLTATHDELVEFSGKWLFQQGVEALGRRPYIAGVREFFKWLYRQRAIAHDPARSLAYPTAGRKIPRTMSLQHAERLMWAPDFTTFAGVRDGAILSILIGCGLRVGGLVGLNRSSIDHIEVKGERRMVIRTREKGGRERLVPVPKEAAMLLRVYLEHDELKAIDRSLPNGDEVLFVSVVNTRVAPHDYRGERRRLTRWAVNDIVRRYGERAGIPRDQLHPHAMRHLFGTELAESDVDLLTRQELLGHADPKSTEIYTHLAMRKKLEESDRGNPLGKMSTPVSTLLQRLGGRK